jgi:NADPH:quinone reductase-like Zn-dependent oxidoreductase
VTAAILVEGTSDKIAVETLAARYGRDLAAEGISVIPIGGAHSIARFLDELAPAETVVGLCDAGEQEQFRRALGANHYVCERDLEDELIRALGAGAVQAVVEAHGDLRAFRTMQKQPEWRGRPVEEQLRRFFGSGGRRKIRYARFLVEALELSRVPRPLEQLLADV